jgi:preprotein translocase subunit SecY
VILALAVVAVIVYIQEGQRRIPIQYASRVRGRRMYQGGATFLPLRVNQAGVIPIIFAVSILLFPTQIASYFQAAGHTAEQLTIVNQIAAGIVNFLSPQGIPTSSSTSCYHGLHVLLHRLHLQARRDGRPAAQERGFIPASDRVRRRATTCPRCLPLIGGGGVLPGSGGGFAAHPAQAHPRASEIAGGFALGGTALLIVVSVVVETMKQIEAQ